MGSKNTTKPSSRRRRRLLLLLNSLITMITIPLLLLSLVSVRAEVDCTTVTQLLSTCSVFITYGSPDPLPDSPCCDAVVGLNNLADSSDDRRSVCRCLMGLIATYHPSGTALATLPGFCGVSFGFTIDSNTDCNYIP